MATFRERAEARLTEWINSGKSNRQVLVFPLEYDQLRAFLWSSREARKSEEFSEYIPSLGSANFQALGHNNYHEMLNVRECCSRCSTTYKLENLSICVECECSYCYRCVEGSSCRCGGELVG